MRPHNEKLVSDILIASKRVFMEQGYDGASVRVIAASAGVTTGAIYRYYKDKEALFDALVAGPVNELLEQVQRAQESFFQQDGPSQIRELSRMTTQNNDEMLAYMYDHFDAFKLVACHAKGTKYENYIDQLAEIEDLSSLHFVENMREMGYEVRDLDIGMIHILSTALFNGMFETIRHDMPREQAIHYIKDLRDFYTAGWFKILGIQEI